MRQWKSYLRFDVVAGFLVFLIALPLCLGISVASGFPAINGVFTAIFGGIICGFLSNSELTIKGPAAGMIAIVLGCVMDFKAASGSENMMDYLPYVAAVGVISGVIQILFGLFKVGKLADSFPSAVIHGLLASIGLIIIGKQIYPLLGLKPNGSTEAYEAYFEMPMHLAHYAWQVAVIGVTSLAILFIYPLLKKRIAICKIVPAQLVVLCLAIPASMYLFKDFDGNKRSYTYMDHHGHEAKADVKALLVKVPTSPSDLKAATIFPSFSMLGDSRTWYWVVMFTLVGTLESLLSAKAVDTLDPWGRKSDLNRDLLAVGIANTAVAAIGGLPMISEIVRSSANKDFGARTRMSNFFHGVFLFISILVLPAVLNYIPLTALAAMLIYAGCRLANYKEFLHILHIGKEQLFIFVATIAGVLATDLLIGVGIGILAKILVELVNGVSIADFFRMPVTIQPVNDDKVLVQLHGSAVFSNWIMLKMKLDKLSNYKEIVVDCTDCHLIDHTVMTRLTEMQKDFAYLQRSLSWIGLDKMQSLSHHPLAVHKHSTAIAA
jgi:MFS superfamily sulfate permease-like transporter